jgi:hypothetical protein
MLCRDGTSRGYTASEYLGLAAVQVEAAERDNHTREVVRLLHLVIDKLRDDYLRKAPRWRGRKMTRG